MDESSVNPLHCLLEKREVWSSVKAESVKEVGVEVDICDKVAISKARVELESREDKEGGEGELHRSTTT